MPGNRMMRRPHRPPPPMPHMGPPPPMGPPMHPPRGPPPLHLGPRGPVLPVMGLPPPIPVMGHPHPGHSPVVSSCTNSNDPASMDSRLFVGNLNTIILEKPDIEGIFGHYGLIMGISMHKGYAFVQFSHPDEARRAGASEDGKIYAGQAIDINIVSQPKNRNMLKRSTVDRSVKAVKEAPAKKTRVETPVTNQSLQRTLVTLSESTEPAEKPATKSAVTNLSSPAAVKTVVNKTNLTAPKPATVKTNWPDVLICGVCKLQFTSLHSLAQHKKVPCQLRVSSHTKEDTNNSVATGEPVVLLCALCEEEFNNAWALCVHCTVEHKMNIYKTEDDQNSGDLLDLIKDDPDILGKD